MFFLIIKKLRMKKRYKYPALAILFSMLVLIRAFEGPLFYDPFIVFFQNDYLYTSIPEYDSIPLFVNMLYRYTMNSIISLGIVYFAFEKLGYVILATKLYTYGFFVLMLVYGYLLDTEFEHGYLLPFYIRRFIIHPLFLLLLLAALYYEKLLGPKSSLSE